MIIKPEELKIVYEKEDDGRIRPVYFIDAEPVRHGRWIIKDNPGTGWYRITCSECGEDVTSSAPCLGWMPVIKVLWDYCPDCGAKMEEVDNE